MSEKSQRAQAVIDIDSSIRQRIKMVRGQQGVPQALVAKQLGIVPQQYHKYESGVLRLSAGMITQIASVLDVSVMDLVPEDARGDGALDSERKLDVLKQEVGSLVLDEQSEEVLIAIKTLLRKNQTADMRV